MMENQSSLRHEVESEHGDLRFYFAAQRTMLAWVRTGVALMGFGFIVARFGLFLREMATLRGLPATQTSHTGGVSLWIGATMLIVGVAVNGVAAMRFVSFARSYHRAAPLRPPGVAVELILATIVAAIGVILAVYLLRAG